MGGSIGLGSARERRSSRGCLGPEREIAADRTRHAFLGISSFSTATVSHEARWSSQQISSTSNLLGTDKGHAWKAQICSSTK